MLGPLTDATSEIKYGRGLLVERNSIAHNSSKMGNEFASSANILISLGKFVKVRCVVLDCRVVIMIMAMIVAVVMTMSVSVIVRVRRHLSWLWVVFTAVRAHGDCKRVAVCDVQKIG